MIKKKVALVTNIPTPYRDLYFEEISSNIKQFSVFYLREHLEDREWKVRKQPYYFNLDNYFDSSKLGVLNKGLLSVVLNNDVIVIGGYDHPSYIMLAVLCRLFRKQYGVLFDGIAPSRLVEDCGKQSLKMKIKKWLSLKSSFVMANGEVGRRYFRDVIGLDDERIYNQYLSVNNQMFECDVISKQAIRAELRSRLGIKSDQKVVLYSGRFIERKRVTDLIQALSLIKDKDKFVLLLIGSGPDKEKIETQAKNEGVVTLFPGFIHQEELSKYYHASDVLVLPSSAEPWGLVVNEAVSSRLPVVLSSDVGAHLDLIKVGENGFIFQVGDISDLCVCIESSLSLSSESISQASSKIIEDWNVVNSVTSLLTAIKNC